MLIPTFFATQVNGDYYNVKSRWGLALNAALQVELFNRASIELAFVEGLADYTTDYRAETRLRSFQLTVGYPFRLK